MKHFLLLAAALIAAIACYAAGFETGAVVLIVGGALFELAFWLLALRGVGKNRSA
jgi:hypothetical protein